MYVDDDENIYFGHNLDDEWGSIRNLFFKIPYDKELKYWIDFIPSPTFLDYTYLWKIVPISNITWPEGIANPVMGDWLVAWKIDNDFEYMYLAENVGSIDPKSKIWKFHIADETMSLYCYPDVGLTDFVMDDQGYPIAIASDASPDGYTVIRINPNDNSYEIIAGVPGVFSGPSQKILNHPSRIFRTTNGNIYILDGFLRIVKIIN